MTKKQRKTLDDALAEQFVYGEGEPKDGATAPPAAPPPVKENPEPPPQPVPNSQARS
jgi:hypothetical protein